ncbi:MAG: helix-turn-helix transcriptional regulator [Proteobacteria bacterium]|nr:helix-turn-helix transcriptional regulator [Pseudomonadota bacterium]
MNEAENFADIAALMGDPARARILASLMGGRVLSASDLARRADLSQQATGVHLGKLTAKRLLVVERFGRVRYFRLAGHTVVQALKALGTLAVNGHSYRHKPPISSPVLRRARMCYDHLAGELGVAVTKRLVVRGHLRARDDRFVLTARGEATLRNMGIDIDTARQHRQNFACTCLDWSERQPHLAGSLGSALASRCLADGWVQRLPNSRALRLTKRGRQMFKATLGLALR